MKTEILRLLMLCLSCMAGTVLSAEEGVESKTAIAATDAVEVVETAALPSTQAPQMSAVTTGNVMLAEAEGASAQGAYTTAMAPGICLVVDEFVRQYCSANPDDISCQFQ